jgi:integrase
MAGEAVRLRGINRVTKVLADGSVKTFHYLGRGKGAIRLEGEPGSPEFIHSYHQANEHKIAPVAGTLQSVLTAYQQSSAFTDLRPSTREGYAWHIARIEREFADFPLKALPDQRSRDVFLKWRDQIARSSPRQADYTWQVLKAILNWARDRGLVTHNPCERGGKLYRGSPVDKIWTLEDEAAFLEKAHPIFHLPLLMGLWTGQRKGDLLQLPWSGYDGTFIRLRQRKTDMRVAIPVGGPLKAALDATRKVGPIILVNHHGRPWLTNTFGRGWREACRKAGVTGLTFHDLRGTAVTRVSLAGCTVPEIAAITGHSLAGVARILDAHYLHRDPALAASAIRKLEENVRRSTLQTNLQTGDNS